METASSRCYAVSRRLIDNGGGNEMTNGRLLMTPWWFMQGGIE